MAIDLYLMRHGESTYNETGELVQVTSPHIGLSDKGKEQAYRLGDRLAEEGRKFDKLFCSTTKRTQQTAQILALCTHFPYEDIIFADDLRELSQGKWEGQPRKEVFTLQVREKMRQEPYLFRPPGGESRQEAERRKVSYIERHIFIPEHEGLFIGLVGHAHISRCYLRSLLDANPSSIASWKIDNTSITHVRRNFEQDIPPYGIIKVNDTAHLSHGIQP